MIIFCFFLFAYLFLYVIIYSQNCNPILKFFFVFLLFVARGCCQSQFTIQFFITFIFFSTRNITAHIFIPVETILSLFHYMRVFGFFSMATVKRCYRMKIDPLSSLSLFSVHECAYR